MQTAAGCAGTLSGLEYVLVEGPLDSNPNKLAFAPCPPGTKTTGGGAYTFPQTTELALLRSEPGGGGNGWIAPRRRGEPVRRYLEGRRYRHLYQGRPVVPAVLGHLIRGKS